jgi:hypothetical protein
MTGKKLDFSMHRLGRIEAVKVRIFKGWNGGTFAQLDGGIFNGWEPDLDQLDEVLRILQDVREAVGKGADAKST